MTEQIQVEKDGFAERGPAQHPDVEGVVIRRVQSIAIIGAGTMGTGIAIAALDAGFHVLLLEREKEALEQGERRIGDHYATRVSKGKISASLSQEQLARLQGSIDWQLLARIDLVIEAVFEDLAVKQDVFRRLDGLLRPGSILASNTSYLDLDKIASATFRPSDVVGLHFFSPANVMRLVEVVGGAATAPEVLATAVHFAKRMGKLPVIAGNAFGFIGNRVYSAYRRQCEFLLEEGAYPEQVDAALEAFGFAMGPFAVADMSGLDIAWRMRKSQAATRDPDARYVDIPDRLCELGRLGKKTLAGYYLYEAGSRERKVDLLVTELIDRARSESARPSRPLADEEIQRRALLAMANEAALLLAEGVAQRPDDVDVVLVNGFGFPKREGGPVCWARKRGQEALENDIGWLASRSGPGFVRGNLTYLWKGED
ncbi:3-hydroxyacyl-CoA dehydrogenase NAD-binding domain-containing protein [Noviherbaspirillum sp. 1P10PC]|uniref:3-hydroxyacyl-CoA dehydrogenase n=1 Tax=Noviherbaspirillum sp. 1P10PC TaxID=3132292 RepID=UPI0039A10B6C